MYSYDIPLITRSSLVHHQGRLGAKTRGGSTPDFESDKIYSPTKLYIFSSAYVFLLDFLSAFLSIGLPVFRLVLSFHFLSIFLFPIFFSDLFALTVLVRRTHLR